jgi:hypothetical protein
MRFLSTAAVIVTFVLPATGATQSTTTTERGVYLTAFRSPATGIEVRSGHAAAFAGFYPTVLRKDGVRANANFIRTGVTWYVRDSGATAYVSPSLVVSLGDTWKSGALTEIGFRGRLFSRVNGRLGAAVLTTFDKQVRVNPTVGLDIKLGGAR